MPVSLPTALISYHVDIEAGFVEPNPILYPGHILEVDHAVSVPVTVVELTAALPVIYLS